MKSAIIYVKGSTENELNWQIFALVKWCVKNDYEIKGIYKEHASFFSNKNEILNSIINNEDKADIIVLYDISVIPSEKGGDDKRWSCPSEIQTIARNMPIYSLKEKKEFKVNDSGVFDISDGLYIIENLTPQAQMKTSEEIKEDLTPKFDENGKEHSWDRDGRIIANMLLDSYPKKRWDGYLKFLYSKQPNGKYCHFSNILNTITEYNLEEDEAIGLWCGDSTFVKGQLYDMLKAEFQKQLIDFKKIKDYVTSGENDTNEFCKIENLI